MIATPRAASRRLKILYIAYPLLPISEESCGGAEQVLVNVEREMNRRGHDTVVAACRGSKVAGEVFVTGEAPKGSDQFQVRNAEHNRRVLGLIRERGREFDLVHDQSGTFWQDLKADDTLPVPVLVTLHLPRSFYSEEAFARVPDVVTFNCVSQTQLASFRDVQAMCVPNGINLHRYPFSSRTGRYLLWLGRICEEKGAHLAIEVAQRTGRQLMIAGQVYPFSYHRHYFREMIWPHLDGERVTWFESPNHQLKLELLQNAQAVLIPSLVEETSSLVAMEAMACGTPVIAFRRGALPEVIADGRTGFIVDSTDEMARAVDRVGQISANECRQHVEERFSATRMADDYERLYHRMAAKLDRTRAS